MNLFVLAIILVGRMMAQQARTTANKQYAINEIDIDNCNQVNHRS